MPCWIRHPSITLFDFQNKCIVLLQSEVMPVINHFRIFIQDNHRNMELLISFDRLSQSYRNKGPTFSARVEKRPKSGIFHRAGATLSDGPTLSLITFLNRSDEILVVFKLIDDGRQNGPSPVFKTGCRPFLRVFYM
jgi:hypothetical protein